jgi:Response regulators consisting of a CheY-like receiver domain and a winged-helix DNA-binding domain
MKTKIVIVEDETDIRDLITMHGELEGFQVLSEADGLHGYRLIEDETPDLVILDWMLPGQSGLDICRKMKQNPALKSIPIIMLTAKAEEFDQVLGLEMGADDFISKPFSPKVLFTRVKTVLRRGKDLEEKAKTISFGPFVLEIEHYLLKKNGKNIPLTLSEFGILHRLLASRGKVLTRNQLLDNINSEDTFVIDRNIDVHIASLRKKLGPNFNNIATVRGVGYRFIDE